VYVDGKTLVIDEEGVALERPFKLSVPSANTSETQRAEFAARAAALPLVVAKVSREENSGAVSGEGLSTALRLLALNREQSVAKSRPASLANGVHPTPPQPTDAPAPKPKTPQRVLRVHELEDRPLEVESIDARNPRKIVVQFKHHHRRGVTAWFSESYLAEGLSNFYRAYAYRLLTVPIEEEPRLVSSASTATPPAGREQTLSSTPSSLMRGNQESSRERVSTGVRSGVVPQESSFPSSAVASSTNGDSSPILYERYDARFESTLYITTSPGGQNG
jgi:hypothetical protein